MEYGCGAVFTKWKRYQRPVARKNPEAKIQSEPPFTRHNVDCTFEEGPNVPPRDRLEWCSAQFLIHIRENCKVSQTCIDSIIDGVRDSRRNFSTIILQFGSTEHLVSTKGASPRIVAYTVEFEIPVAYLVADSTIRPKIEEPSTYKILQLFMASYFTWDTAYPPAHSNTLDYLGWELVRPLKRSTLGSRKIRTQRPTKIRTVNRTIV